MEMEEVHCERLVWKEERAIDGQRYRRHWMKPLSAIQPACYMCMATNEPLPTLIFKRSCHRDAGTSRCEIDMCTSGTVSQQITGSDAGS